jgi:predicted lipoprotein
MRKNIFWIVVGAIAAAVLLYHSVYVENLTERRAREAAPVAETPISQLWADKLPALLEQALPLNEFTAALAADPADLIDRHGKSSGIGPFYSFILQAEATLDAVSDEELFFDAGNQLAVAVPIRYIFSNAVRDASGWFRIDDYENTMDYNTVSSDINQHILSQVVTEEVRAFRAGDRIRLCGVAEINRKELPDRRLEIIPISIQRHE